MVIFYLLALLPRLIARSMSGPSHKDASVFFAVGMVLSSFALPIVLARASVVCVLSIHKSMNVFVIVLCVHLQIHAGASYLTVAANFVNFFTIAMYLKLTDSQDEAYVGNF